MRKGNRRRIPPLNRIRTEDGFSIVDATVAIGIFAVVMVLISSMLATGMRGVLLGKRREVAVQEANKMLEFARSLPYDEIGLAADDPTLATDPAIDKSTGVNRYLVNAATSTYEPILFAANTATHPYNPHITQVNRGSTNLTSHVYVTGVDTDGNGAFDYKRVIAHVRWRDDGTAGPANDVRAHTFVDENGIVPVGSPPPGTGTLTGRVPMKAETRADAGNFSIFSDRGDLAALVGAVLPADPVAGTLARTTGFTDTKVVTDVNCTARPTFLEGPAGTSYGDKHPISITADDDPSAMSTNKDEDEEKWEGSPADPVTDGGEVDRLLLEAGISSDASCLVDALYTDGLPYEHGQGSGPANLTFTEDISGAGLGTDVLTLAAVGSSTASQTIDHGDNAGAREIVSRAGGSAGTTSLMKIAGVIPDGLVHVDSYGYEAIVTSTDPALSPPAPSVTVPGGINVKVFDPAASITGCSARSGSYCVMTIDPLSGRTVSVVGTVTANLGLTKLSFETTVQAFPPAQSTAGGVVGPNGEKRWSASYTSLAISTRLKIEVTVDALLGTKVLLTDSVSDMGIGNVSVHACSGVSC